jgi:hypothetical protein
VIFLKKLKRINNMFVIPNKYISFSRSYLGIGGILLSFLKENKKIEDLWYDSKKFFKAKKMSIDFFSFQQALNLLFLLDIIKYNDGGIIERCS